MNTMTQQRIDDSFCEQENLARPTNQHNCGTPDRGACLAGHWETGPLSMVRLLLLLVQC